MMRTWIRVGLAILGLGVFLARSAAAQQEVAVAVEPADLATRKDLVGKLVIVDDRIKFFQNHPRIGYDEIYLRRTPLTFRLPVALRPQSPPPNPAVVLQGRLVREGSRIYVDVVTMSLQPSDLERFEKGVAALSPRDFEGRRDWVRWASKRATAFGDAALGDRARIIERDALRIEGDARRVAVDAPREWLKLAQQGRKQGVAEPEPSAQAHRGFRALLAAAGSLADLETLRRDVEAFFPKAAAPTSGVDLGAWADKARKDPSGAYRDAPADLRPALDHQLWADLVQKSLESRVANDVKEALQAVDEAAKLLPDRPELTSRWIDQAQERARGALPSLRLAELKAVGELLSGPGKNPGAALELYRDWLKAQQSRLSDTDAEGPVTLASHYETLIHDSDAAHRLLERAWKIAPGSAMVAEAFRSRGYRRVGDDWLKDAPSTVETAAVAAPAPAEVEQGLRGKNPDEVRAVMGQEPTSKSIVASRGRVMLQWVFADTRQKRYVNFLHVAGSQKPRVVSDFLLSR